MTTNKLHAGPAIEMTRQKTGDEKEQTFE